MMEEEKEADFAAVTPERVLDVVEEALGERCTGLIRALPSYINRVYGVELCSGEHVVAKFYRPGRWAREAVADEHAFVCACAEEEIPVIAPLGLAGGGTLGESGGVAFALFPRRGGRPVEPGDASDEMWERMGALLARIHRVGEREAARHRVRLHPEASVAADIAFLLEGGFLEGGEAARLRRFGEGLLEVAGPLFEGAEEIRLHGDCQRTNVLDRPDTGIFLIDFDDMMMGPPVQDVWMLLPGRVGESRMELALLLEGYEMFREFDRGALRLVEPLRAMRMLYFLAWRARQAGDAAFQRECPDWGTRHFWARELGELEEQLGVIVEGSGF